MWPLVVVVVSVCGCIGVTTVGTGGDWSPQLLGLGTNNVLVPQLLGRSFQKARNFTASSHQNAGFSISVFKKFSGGNTLPHPTPSKHPGVGTQTLVPLNFSAVVAPLCG